MINLAKIKADTEAVTTGLYHAKIPRRMSINGCALCGYSRSSAIHLPAITGPRKGLPYDHAYIAKPAIHKGTS